MREKKCTTTPASVSARAPQQLLAQVPAWRLLFALAILWGIVGTVLSILQMFVLSTIICDVFLSHADLAQLRNQFLWLLVLIGGHALFASAREVSVQYGTIDAKATIRQRVFAHLLRLGSIWAQGERSGELVATLGEGVERLDAYSGRYLPQVVLCVLIPLLLLLVIFPCDLLSALLLLITAPLIPLLMILVGSQAEKQSQLQWKALAHMSAHFLDVVQGLTTLKLFGRSQAEQERVARISEAFREKTMVTLRLAFLSGTVLEFLTSMAIGLVAVTLGVRLIDHQLSLHVALFVLLLVPEFYRPLRDLGTTRHAGLEGRASAQRLSEILDQPPPVQDQPGEVQLPAGELEIALHNVTYTYPGNGQPTLHNISLELPAGTCTALVGRSGAGKSTLARLLLRWLEAGQGTITANGIPIEQLPIEDWRERVAFVSQRPYLFYGSVRENILLARPTASEAELHRAAELAGALTFIQHLPQGFATPVGEQGAQLSAGQVQRIALARAFLKNAPLLILDEPTSSLDPESEHAVRQALAQLVRGRTVLVIAHRLSTIAAASRVFVLEQGNIVEAGAPATWLRRVSAVGQEVSLRLPQRYLQCQDEAYLRLRPVDAIQSIDAVQPADAVRPGQVFWRLLKMQMHLGGPVLLAALLGCILVAGNLGLLSVAAYLITASAVVSLLALLTVPIFFVRLMGLVRPLARYGERCVSHDLTFRLLARLRTRVYACLEPLAPALLFSYRSGDLLARLVADIDELQHLYLRLLAPLLVAGGISLLTFAVLSSFSMLLAWMALAFLVLAAGVVPLLCWWLARGLGVRQLALRAEQKAALLDGVQGMPDLLAYGQTRPYLRKIGAIEARLCAIQRRLGWLAALQEGLTDLLKQGSLWSLLVLALPLVTSGQIDGIYLGSLALLMLASFEIVPPLGQTCQFLGHTLAAGRRLFALLDATPVVEEPARPLALPDNGEGYELTFEHVSFSYNQGILSTLNDINVRVRPGCRVALVGSSGAGKSTLLRLALRSWDVDAGRITLNGQDIRQYALNDLRGLMGVVTQDTYLFNTTLRGNLLLARPQASEEELLKALEQAQLGEFVRQLPGGLETWPGEQGMRLSGGERQRLAIARALLKDAPILLLDEVTANLDPKTELEVLTALHTLMNGRTVLLVTHRLIGMENMDEIIVIEDGRIQEQGTHEQLLACQGRYARLWNIQQSVFTIPADAIDGKSGAVGSDSFTAEVGDDVPASALSSPQQAAFVGNVWQKTRLS